MNTTVKVIDQRFIAEFAEKYSDPSKLTLSIQFEATMLSNNVFSNENRINLLSEIKNEIYNLIEEIGASTAVDCWDGDETHHINHGC